MLSTIRSFRPLTAEECAKITGMRLHLVTARACEDLEQLGQRTGTAWNIAISAAYNGLFTTHRFEGGEPAKTTRLEPYQSQSQTPR